jgi:ABC-type glycerol-3-phosphate transport system substrate-binding protein
MKKRLIASMLLLSLLAASGCGDVKSNANETTSPSSDTSETITARDNIPEGLNFNGKTIRVYVRGDTLTTEFDAEESGDIVDDAIFNRNRSIEERLNINLEYFANTSADFWADRNLYMDTVRSSVMANDGSIDIVAGLSLMMPFMAMEGLFYNLLSNDMPYLDFTSPWWSKSLIDELAVNNKLYFASGEASLGVIKGMMCIYFNKNLIENLKLENPYDLVLNNKWTLAKLREMSTVAYSDLNGNSQVDAADQFGFIIRNENHATNFINSSELRFTRTNKDGIPEMALGEEKVIDLLQKLSEIMNENSSKAILDGTTDSSFEDGRLLFGTGEFANAANFRDLEFDFGVIPYPLYDENQSNYYTTSRNTFSCLAIPITTDKEATAAALELMASESYYEVTPAFYEKALKVKYSRDDISAQMFDIIKNGVCYDFGTMFNQVLTSSNGSGINVVLRQTICKGETTWASRWASEKEGVEAKLVNAIQTLTNLEH